MEPKDYSENLDNSISYSEYVAENLDKTIEYSEYTGYSESDEYKIKKKIAERQAKLDNLLDDD